jgi:hypothetical protein
MSIEKLVCHMFDSEVATVAILMSSLKLPQAAIRTPCSALQLRVMMVNFAPLRPMKIRESVIPFRNNAAFDACFDGYEWHG